MQSNGVGDTTSSESIIPTLLFVMRKSILLVDDDALVRRSVMRALRDSGFELHPAESAEKALELMADRGAPFDLIITDVVMSGMSGVAFSETVRLAGVTTPIILVTGFPGAHLSPSPLTIERLRLLPKPFTPKALRDEIAGMLSLA